MTPSIAIYTAAGSPALDGDLNGACRTCGQDGYGLEFREWVRPTFTDWDKLHSGKIICQPCQFCFEDHNPALDARLGKPRQRMRNYSHFVLDGEWYPLSKGQKPAMVELLLRSPEVAIIADSGQKHIIFRARVGWWQFEEYAIKPEPVLLHSLITRIIPMLAIFSKAEIGTANYIASRISQWGVKRWQSDEDFLRQHRGSKLFELGLFLSTKEEECDTSGVSGKAAVPVLEGNRERLQEALFNDNLEPV
jgi:hypothetical protein